MRFPCISASTRLLIYIPIRGTPVISLFAIMRSAVLDLIFCILIAMPIDEEAGVTKSIVLNAMAPRASLLSTVSI